MLQYFLAALAMLCMTDADSSIDKRCMSLPDFRSCFRFPRPMYHFNTSSMQCEMFPWGGCQSRAPTNRFETLESCLNICACALPKDSGPCYASVPSWFHDEGMCKEFVYGGCQGNANRFKSKFSCESVCSV